MVYVPYSLVHLIDRAAERHPALKLTLDHLCLTDRGAGEAAFNELDKLIPLARRANVAVKATTLPMYAEDAFPYPRLHPYLRRVYDAFGPKRMFWGSDFTQVPCSYGEAVRMFSEGIPWLSDTDKEWVMGRGISEWLGWPTG
jgi:predicted TIM-barrel fold metal-dependent hydrolase